MKTAKEIPWKQIFVILFLGVGVFIVFEIYKTFAAGERTLKNLLLAPFTAAGKVWTAVTTWLGSLAPGYKPGTIAGTGQTPSQIIGVDASSPLGQMLNSEAPADNAALFGISTPASDSPVVGIWSQPSP